MSERQKHGFDFEDEILKKIGATKSEKYTSEFDGTIKIDGEIIPISVKTKKNKCAIEMGDIFRNSEISTDFILIVAFWENDKYNFVEEYAVYINKETWKTFFLDNFKEDYLNFLNSVTNDYADDQIWKTGCKMRQKLWEEQVGKHITPFFKRDHKKQKRVQCGLNYKTFMDIFVQNFSIDIENLNLDTKKYL